MLLTKVQAGFQCKKSTVDQVVLLTQNIEDFFKAKKKADSVLVDLTAAYDTVWHHGLTCKLLRPKENKKVFTFYENPNPLILAKIQGED